MRFCSEEAFRLAKEYLEVFQNEEDISPAQGEFPRVRFAASRFLEQVPAGRTSDFLSPFCKYGPCDIFKSNKIDKIKIYHKRRSLRQRRRNSRRCCRDRVA